MVCHKQRRIYPSEAWDKNLTTTRFSQSLMGLKSGWRVVKEFVLPIVAHPRQFSSKIKTRFSLDSVSAVVLEVCPRRCAPRAQPNAIA